MSRLLVRLLALFGLARGALRAAAQPAPRDEDDGAVDPSRRDIVATARGERAVAALLGLGGAALAAFGVLVAIDAGTQLLGLVLGAGLVCLAAAAIVAGLDVVPQELAVEQRPPLGSADARRQLADELRGGADGISRRRLILGAAGVAGTGVAAAAVLPITALGPAPTGIDAAPWRDGVALVDADGEPLRARDIVIGSFATAFPRGADRRELGAPVVVLRLDPATIELPAQRRGWAPEGLLAYSKICTHAGCAVSLLRHPLYEPTSDAPALVCPCHYSTFDVRRGAEVLLGPAGRPLAQLPLRLDGEGRLVAAGPLSGSVGPAWWGTDRA